MKGEVLMARYIVWMNCGLRHLLLASVGAALVACGSGVADVATTPSTASVTPADGHVDDGGVETLTQAEQISANIQDVLADRLQATRAAANFSATVDLSQQTVSYEGLPVLNRPNYFEVQASASAYRLVSAQLSESQQNYPADGTNFGFTDIRIIKAATGKIQLINNTPRTFRQILLRKVTGAMLALDFGSSTVLPFSTNTVVADALIGTEVFYETASLFRSAGYRFDASLNEVNGCDGVTTQCVRKGTATEKRRLENTLARMKLAYNTYGMYDWGSQFARSACPGSGYITACSSMGGDYELYMWAQLGKMALHPRGVSLLGYLINYGGTIGQATVGGNPGWMRFTPSAAGTLDTVHHESGHNYGYGHESGLTYGISNDYINRNLQSISNFHIEALPQRAVVATPTTEANTWVISVLTQQAQISRTLRFQLVAREQGFAVKIGRIEGNNNQFVLKITTKPANPIAIKVYSDNTRVNEILGSVVLQAL